MNFVSHAGALVTTAYWIAGGFSFFITFFGVSLDEHSPVGCMFWNGELLSMCTGELYFWITRGA